MNNSGNISDINSNKSISAILQYHFDQFINVHIIYTLDCSIKTLEHIIIIALVYMLVCLGVYRLLLFTRIFNNFKMLNSVRFPKCNRVLFVTAHPDDECMFFGPTIRSLIAQKKSIYLLCLSNGNFEQKGHIRKKELWKSCQKLNIPEDNITLVHATHMVDDPQVHWKTETIANCILKKIESYDIDTLITFDREGVSQHPNHCAIYYAVASLCLSGLIPKDCKIFTLDSINLCRKYMSIFDLVISLLLSTNWCIVTWHEVNRIQQAMHEHNSQMIWFRSLYIKFSRYMIINTLREMNLSDVELEMQINGQE